MTDFPSPSDRSESAKEAPRALLWALFRPFLFASGLIGLALGALLLLLLHRSQPTEIATALPPPVLALPELAPEPPPISAAEFEGGMAAVRRRVSAPVCRARVLVTGANPMEIDTGAVWPAAALWKLSPVAVLAATRVVRSRTSRLPDTICPAESRITLA